jgi:hypothetical protein
MQWKSNDKMYPHISVCSIVFLYLSILSTHLTILDSVSVPDPGSRDRDVVLFERGVCWGNLRGVRNLEWEGDEKGQLSLRATWDQGGQGRITPKEGFQVSKGGIKGEVNG